MILIRQKVKAEDGIINIRLPDDFKGSVVDVVVKTEDDLSARLMLDTVKIDTIKWKFNREEIYGG
ncbi:MAG: hypothetical protein HY959_01270 [Ignavibacteriae bacterium]|nr:hypothetical protein [Ignavibacteriota bacterium]